MTLLHPTDTYRFEQWLLEMYPDLFTEWELEASQWLDLDEWLAREHYHVLDEWWKHRKGDAPIGGDPLSSPEEREST